MRRLLDLLVALTLLVILSPVLLCAGLAVLLHDGAPVLFRQERVGRHGTRFRITKFRSMRSGGAGALVTATGDARITPLGRFLRRTKIDELPQFWNVLLGEMALVGPRPEVPLYVDRHPRLFRGIAPLRPGITDWSSLAFRDEEAVMARHAEDPTYYERLLLPRKVALARLYGRHASLGLDLRLVGATAMAVLRLEGGVELLAGRGMIARARLGVA
jgi:lipopolysaccharide/colanic/teichoic acid biosynthesis glycosyltransferase